ncbi:MAG: hemin uptake protein HemP [Thiobacillus sp.]|nr:hemin uptake protein HemP [Thiobacillus sp.]
MKPDQTEPDVDAMQTQTPSSIRSPVEPGQRTFPPGIIQTDFLFQGNQEILISHNGEHYRLRITKNGKLILTK